MRLFLYLAQLHAEAVELLLGFIVLAVGVSDVLAENLPVAAKVAKRGVELSQVLANFGCLLFYLQAGRIY